MKIKFPMALVLLLAGVCMGRQATSFAASTNALPNVAGSLLMGVSSNTLGVSWVSSKVTKASWGAETGQKLAVPKIKTKIKGNPSSEPATAKSISLTAVQATTVQRAVATPIASSIVSTAIAKSSRQLPAAIPSGSKVAVIPIQGMIYDFTLESLQRRVKRAKAEGATLIVLELDTPGGVVTSALDIAKYIKAKINLPTIAWVNDQAYSAGILIASACDYIVMSPSSTTGDCAPIVPGMELAPTERAKALSPILEEFRDNAASNGYPYVVFQAMCVLGVEVYEIENKTTSQHLYANQADYQVMVQGKSIDGGGLLSKMFGQAKSKTPTSSDVGSATITQATKKDQGQWKLIKQVHDGKTLLTLNQTRAEDLGLSRSSKIADMNDLSHFLSASSVAKVNQSWSENLAGWLTLPVMRSFLVVVLLLGAYVEFQAPGLGLPGAVALGALVILLGAPFLIGLADIWHLIVFAIGVMLLLVEVLLIPGFGIFGISGMIFILTGLILSAVPAGQGTLPLPPREFWPAVQMSMFGVLLGFFGSLAGLVYLMSRFEKVPFFNRLVLQSSGPSQVTLDQVSGSESVGAGKIKVGDQGSVVAPLRPSGRVAFGEHIVDVVSVSQRIDAGKIVCVIEVTGNRIVVDQADLLAAADDDAKILDDHGFV